MEEFRKKLKNRAMILLLLCGFAPILFVTLWFITKGASDFAQGLSMGFLTSIEFCSIVGLVEALVLLRDEKKLKEKYIASTDERNIEISKETMRTSSVISLVVTAFAIMVTGFFSMTVSITLFIDLAVGELITVLVNAYYKKKM